MNLIERMSQNLRMPPERLFAISQSASRRYRRIELERKNKDPRIIWQPSAELRVMQKWLASNLFNLLPVHSSCFSYVEGKNIAMHAAQHRNSSFLSRIDIKGFFPALKGRTVRGFLLANRENLRISTSEIDLVASLALRSEELPIGAPTSPILSNGIMYRFDTKWAELVTLRSSIYTRYADDIYVSSSVPMMAFEVISDLKKDLASYANIGFVVNEEKTFHTSRKRLRRITGVVLTPQNDLSIGREKKRKIKTQVFLALQGDVTVENLRKLLGTLAYVQSVEPEFIFRLAKKFGSNFRQSLGLRMSSLPSDNK